jgi:hypothetical protein
MARERGIERRFRINRVESAGEGTPAGDEEREREEILKLLRLPSKRRSFSGLPPADRGLLRRILTKEPVTGEEFLFAAEMCRLSESWRTAEEEIVRELHPHAYPPAQPHPPNFTE